MHREREKLGMVHWFKEEKLLHSHKNVSTIDILHFGETILRGALNVHGPCWRVKLRDCCLVCVCDLEVGGDGAGEDEVATLRPLRVPAPPGAQPALGQAHRQARTGVLASGGEVVFVHCGQLGTCCRSWAESSMGVR